MARRERRRDGAKESQWREVLGQFVASGLSVRAFCARQRVSEPSFYAWRRELALRDREPLASSTRSPSRSSPRRASTNSALATIAGGRRSPSAPTPFVPVVLTAEPTASSAIAIEVTLPTGVLLRVPSGCDPATLHMLLAALRNDQEPTLC